MRNPWRVGGFEKRLLVFFLLLSVTPTLIIAVFSARYFVGTVKLVSNPALDRSFQNSVEIARGLSARLGFDARTAALRLRRDWAQPWPRAQSLEAMTLDAGTDFAAVYVLEGSSWRLQAAYPAQSTRIDSVLPAGPVPADARARAATEPVEFTDPDIIASGAPSGSDTLFVAGFMLEKGLVDMMRQTGDDLGRYRAVGLYVSILRRYIIIVTCVLVAMIAVSSGVLSRLLAGRISQPIKELALGTQRIAKGDLDYRVTVSARDEIATLVADFNKMTQELQENKRNLVRAERIAAWRDVARRIAHEIKNPLTPIEISIYRLKKRLTPGAEDMPPAGGAPSTDEDAEDRRVIDECLDSMLKEVATLRTIAQEFSSYAKLPEPRFERVNVNQIVRSVLGLYSTSFHNIRVETDLPPGLPDVRADNDQLRSVVSNLIKNAVEAMPNGGRLAVRTSMVDAPGPGHGAYLRIAVSDTGTGIPEDIRDKVFDPYFTTKVSGTGLGLAMAYRIVQDHRGKINFTTGASGTIFTVDLPVRRTEAGQTDAG